MRCWLNVVASTFTRRAESRFNLSRCHELCRNNAADRQFPQATYHKPYLLPLCFSTFMALRIGQVIRGVKGNYELLHSLKGVTVFKAKVLSGPSVQAKWAMVKSAATDEEKMCLSREWHNYKINKIATSPYIRGLCDVVQ